MNLGENDIETARAMVDRNPEDLSARHRLACVLEKYCRKEEARQEYRRILELSPDHLPALVNLANLNLKSDLTEAENLCQKAMALAPDRVEPILTMGGILTMRGQADEALKYYRMAVEAAPGSLEAISHMLLVMHYPSGIPAGSMFEEHVKYGRLIEAPFADRPKVIRRKNGNKIRIGYVSGDFCRHSVAYFVEPLIYSHDRSKFDVFCYSDVSFPDETTDRFKNLSNWRNIAGLPDEAVYKQIVDDKIDVLVDLGGHTSRRIRLFAMRPPALLVTYAGYPDTTGLSCMDFRISDIVADPPENQAICVEKILRLDGCFLVFSPPEAAPDVAEAPVMSNGFVTFGSFNAMPKINDETIGLWAAILKSVSGSKILLKNSAMADAGTRSRLLRRFAENGVDEKSVLMAQFTHGFSDHLGTYNQVDIALDTFPYNGTTTTCESLWMGVPVITLSGETHASRVGKSLMTCAGLASLTASGKREYLKIARMLAGDRNLLQNLRLSLRSAVAGSPLCDAKRFAAVFERAVENALDEKSEK